jgi:abequosyltransferase
MNFGPLLTIVIPTYNRASCLGLLLESILIQLKNVKNQDIEVLIFDNCSTDSTKEVAQSFASKSPIFNYVRNDENIGADNNFVKGFLSAKGKYLWMLGDDELLLDGAIPWVMNFCNEYDFGCLFLSPIPEMIDAVPSFLGKPIELPVRVRKYSAYKFAQAVNYGITFLSGSIVNREKLLEFNPQIKKDIESYSKSNLVHLTWIYSAILSAPSSYFAITPIFAGTMVNSGGYRPVKVFIVNLPELFARYFSSINPNAKRFIRQVTLMGWFPKVVFDLRFSQKYRATNFGVDESEFPAEMKVGIIWWIFHHMVLSGPKAISFAGAVFLKLLSKFFQKVYVLRGKSISVGLFTNEN